jgi:hypothetical protein
MPLFELTEEQKLREAEQQVHQIVQEMVAAVASHAYAAKQPSAAKMLAQISELRGVLVAHGGNGATIASNIKYHQ